MIFQSRSAPQRSARHVASVTHLQGPYNNLTVMNLLMFGLSPTAWCFSDGGRGIQSSDSQNTMEKNMGWLNVYRPLMKKVKTHEEVLQPMSGGLLIKSLRYIISSRSRVAHLLAHRFAASSPWRPTAAGPTHRPTAGVGGFSSDGRGAGYVWISGGDEPRCIT